MRTLIYDETDQGKRLDEITVPILQNVMRHFDFEGYLSSLESDSARKQEIIIAQSVGFIDDAMCARLIKLYNLENA